MWNILDFVLKMRWYDQLLTLMNDSHNSRVCCNYFSLVLTMQYLFQNKVIRSPKNALLVWSKIISLFPQPSLIWFLWSWRGLHLRINSLELFCMANVQPGTKSISWECASIKEVIHCALLLIVVPCFTFFKSGVNADPDIESSLKATCRA